MNWQTALTDFSALQDLNWSAPETWPRSVRLASLLIVALVSLAVVWLLDDSSAELAFAERERMRLESRARAAQRQTKQVVELRERSQALGRAVGDRAQGYLRRDELSDLLQLLSTLSAEHGVLLDGMEVAEARESEGIEFQPIELAFRGAYHDIGYLYAALVDFPWLVVVEGFEVRPTTGDPRELDMRVSVLLPLFVSES